MQIESIALERRGSPTAAVFRWLRGPWLLLLTVGLVVVLVSLPLLRGLALRENELDAIQTMNLLGREVFAAETSAPLTLGELVGRDEVLLRRLPDTRLLEEGRLLLRHGYLFELVRIEAGAPLLRAWPYSYGETGLGAFCATSTDELLGHPNSLARWSGPALPPPGLPAEDPSTPWREMSYQRRPGQGF